MLEIQKFLKLLKEVTRQDHVIYTIAALTTGIVAVIYARLFSYAEILSHGLFEQNKYLMLLASPLCFVLATWIVMRFSPGASGSGIPQVMATIEDSGSEKNHLLIDRFLTVRVILTKIASSIVCVLGGGAIGREGPTIQIGAGIFDLFARYVSHSRERLNEKYWIVTGGASGLAAAFNTPLGGLVYAIEELATPEFNKFKSYLISAVIIAGFSAQSITGRYLYVGYANLGSVKLSLIPAAVLVGLLTGLAGAYFGHWTTLISTRVGKLTKTKRLIYAGVIGLVISLVAVFVDSTIYGSGRETFQQILFHSETNSSPLTVILRFVGPLFTFSTGAAGGIFAPSLAAGGAIGGYLGQLFSDVNTNLMIILGMIGFLTGVTRAPFTSFVLVFEMTDRHSAIFLMMLTALVATNIGKVVASSSVYEELKQRILKAHQEAALPEPTTPN